MKTIMSVALSLIAASVFAVSENTMDYSAFRIGETPCGVMLSVYDGLESRGFSWQVTNSVETTEVQLLKGAYGASDAATFASVGQKLPSYIRTDSVKNLGMDTAAKGYKAFVTGLEPGATYSYRIVATYDGGVREACAYGTFTVKAAGETVTVVNISDVQTKDGAKYYKAANACAAAATTAGGADKIDFIVQNGDFFHTRQEKMTNFGVNTNSLNNTRWAMAVETLAPYFPSVPWVNVGGNHDDSAYVFTAAEAFAITNSPFAQGVIYVGGHSFTRGNVHVTTVPFNLMFDGKNYSADGMYKWLEDDLAASVTNANIKWRVVAMHFGPYTTGDHALDSANGYAETTTASNLIVRLAPMLASNRVDLVLQGHDHTYSKTVPYLWSGKGYTTSETDATALNLAPTTETSGGITYDVDPMGTYYVSAGCVGHRVGENVNYANQGTTKSYTHRNLKVATGKVNVTSSVSAAGDNASKDTGKQMFGVLKATGDRLVYSFYIIPTDGVETAELYDTLAIRKTSASDAPVTPPVVDPDPVDDPDPEDDPDPVVDPDPQPQPTPQSEKKAEPVVGPRPLAEGNLPTEYPEGVKTVSELVSALTSASAGSVVYVEPGTYDLTGVQMATSGTSAKKSHLSLVRTIAIVGTTTNASEVVLKGDDTSHRILMFNKGGSTLTLSNLTFTCGKVDEYGGGVYLYAGSARCVNCRFVSNRSSCGGGFAVKQNTALDCEFKWCSFIGNLAGTGGGLYLYQKGVTLDCTFEGNKATGWGGGAQYGAHTNAAFIANLCSPTTSPTGCGGGALAYGVATDCLFAANTNDVALSHGGATYHTTVLDGCLFRGNYGAGNGLVAAPDLVDGCTFEDNSCGEAIIRRAVTGGGTVQNSVFRRNKGIVIAAQNDSTRRAVYNCLFEENTNSVLTSYCDLGNCTFVRNECKNSPVSGNETAVNCVFSGNAPQDIYASGYPTMTNCVFVTRSGSSELDKATDCKQVADVKFADAANGNYLPKGLRSPLCNAGLNTAEYLSRVGETDLNGAPRVMFGRIDVGAFELQKLKGLQVLVR